MKPINLFKLIPVVFLISWIGVTPSLLIAYGYDIPKGLQVLQILMTLGPILGVIIFIFQTNGKQGINKLFSRLFIFRGNALAITIAVFLPIVASLLAASIGLKISATSWPDEFDWLTILSNGLIISATYLVINTEEIAWRGVVFDQLLTKWGFIKSCLIIAPIWWIFHIPLFFYPNGHPAGYGLVPFTFIVIGQTLILGWIYVKTNRSLFYIHLHHQLINGFGQAFPIFPVFINGNQVPTWTLSLVILIGGLIILIKAKKVDFRDSLKP